MWADGSHCNEAAAFVWKPVTDESPSPEGCQAAEQSSLVPFGLEHAQYIPAAQASCSGPLETPEPVVAT